MVRKISFAFIALLLSHCSLYCQSMIKFNVHGEKKHDNIFLMVNTKKIHPSDTFFYSTLGNAVLYRNKDVICDFNSSIKELRGDSILIDFEYVTPKLKCLLFRLFKNSSYTGYVYYLNKMDRNKPRKQCMKSNILNIVVK